MGQELEVKYRVSSEKKTSDYLISRPTVLILPARDYFGL